MKTRLVRQLLVEKDDEIERLKRDLVDAVQNIQAHSMIVDASEKEVEIERLQKRVLEFIDLDVARRKLITELADALDQQSCWSTKVELIQRAREATR